MRLLFISGALATPVLVRAMAWTGPKETLHPAAVESWSPAPTSPPSLYESFFELFKRQQEAGNNTCGYVSGSYSRSLTCNNGDYVCATNTFYGVHGCCDPASMDACTLPTTCVASASLSACTGACLTNDMVAKCTNALNPYCYNWIYEYPGTRMTEWGCYNSPFVLTVERTYTDGPATLSSLSTSIPSTSSTITSPSSSSTSVSSSSSSSSSTSPTPTQVESQKSTPVGAIAGGVVGGVAVIGAIAAGLIYFCLRSRKKKNQASSAAALANNQQPPQTSEYNKPPAPGPYDPRYSQGYPPQMMQNYPPHQQQQPGTTASYYQPPPVGVAGGMAEHDNKYGYVATQQPMGAHSPNFSQQQNPYSPPTSPSPHYSQQGYQGPAQLDGTPVQPPPAPSPQHQGAGGQTIYEAPTSRD